MRKVILFAGLVLALAALLPGSARSAAHGTSLPLKGWSSGHMTLNMATGELHTWGEWTPVSHMGMHIGVSDGWAAPDGSGGLIIFATVAATTANGDHLFGTLANDVITFTSGSGHFEGATGYVTGGSQNVTNVVVSPEGIMSADMYGPVEGVLNLNRP